MTKFQQAMKKCVNHAEYLYATRTDFSDHAHEYGREKYFDLINAVDHAEYVLSLCKSPQEYMKISALVIRDTASLIGEIKDGKSFTAALLQMDGSGKYSHGALIPEDIQDDYILRTPREIAGEGEEFLSRHIDVSFDQETVETAAGFMDSGDADDYDAIIPPASVKNVTDEWDEDMGNEKETDYIGLIRCINCLRALDCLREKGE